MPDIKTDDGCIIHVEVEGPQHGPVLMLSNSLGTNLHMWDDQVPAWSRHFRLVRYDRRGHGQSSVPKGPYPMERLGRDVLAVIDALGIAKMNWCGLSMGGMVGQWLGANAPNRIDKLVLSNTSSYFADKSLWEGRLKTVRDKGLAAIVDANMERWFTKEFRAQSASDRTDARNVLGNQAGGLYRLRRRDPRYGSSRAAGENQRTDAGDRGQTRSRNSARSQRVHPPPHPRCTDRGARCGAYRQYRAAADLR
jgi:3-oxoadipate enol-lactonase